MVQGMISVSCIFVLKREDIQSWGSEKTFYRARQLPISMKAAGIQMAKVSALLTAVQEVPVQNREK